MLVVKGIKLQFLETKRIECYFLDEDDRIIIMILREGKQNIVIDGFVYTLINIHINLSLLYEKVTYQIININFRKILEVTKSATKI